MLFPVFYAFRNSALSSYPIIYCYSACAWVVEDIFCFLSCTDNNWVELNTCCMISLAHREQVNFGSAVHFCPWAHQSVDFFQRWLLQTGWLYWCRAY